MGILLDPSKQFISIEIFYVEEVLKHGNSIFHFIRSADDLAEWKSKGYVVEGEAASVSPTTPSMEAKQTPDKLISKLITHWTKPTWKDQNIIISRSLKTTATGDGTVNELDGVKQQVNDLAGNNELLKNAIDLNRELGTESYDERVVLPLVRSLFPVVDFIHDAQAALATNTPRYQRAIQYLDGLHTQIAQFLASYGIEIFRHDAEEKFNPKLMQPIKREPTGDRKLTSCIAASLQCGFKKDERILRLEKVSLYKHEEQEKNVKGKEL